MAMKMIKTFKTMDNLPTLETGGIIGKVNLVDIKDSSDSQWYNEGCKAWVLENPQVLPFVPLKGKLGLFNVKTTELIKKVI